MVVLGRSPRFLKERLVRQGNIATAGERSVGKMGRGNSVTERRTARRNCFLSLDPSRMRGPNRKKEQMSSSISAGM